MILSEHLFCIGPVLRKHTHTLLGFGKPIYIRKMDGRKSERSGDVALRQNSTYTYKLSSIRNFIKVSIHFKRFFGNGFDVGSRSRIAVGFSAALRSNFIFISDLLENETALPDYQQFGNMIVQICDKIG